VQSPHLHISYFSEYWHQGESFLPQTHFVGGTLTPPQGDPPAWLADIPADQPLGLVTLGTTFTGDLGFFAQGARALARSGMVPIVVIGFNPITPEEKDELKRHLPGGARLLNWIDYDHVFPRLKAIIHHGGMGTTHAAILHALPQVIVPHAADQRGQARRARQAKVGLELLADEVEKGQLGPAVQAVTTTPLVLNAVRTLAAAFADLGGPAKAADLLVALASR
jgi:MGT family glycosyltransferase